MKIAIVWQNTLNERIIIQQNQAVLRTILFGHEPVIFDGTVNRPFLSDVLLQTSKLEHSNFFAWINSDCVPFVDFSMLAVKGKVIGLKRIETIDNSVCSGVDGYIFDINVWNKYYIEDMPQLYVGATHVDWWLTRVAQKYNLYTEMTSLIHISHPPSESTLGIDNYGVHNLNNYSEWAKRHNISLK